MGKFISNAEWPDCVSTGKIPNVSTDEHDSEEAAQIVCNRLETHGLGGEGKVFPLRTWVEFEAVTAAEVADVLAATGKG